MTQLSSQTNLALGAALANRTAHEQIRSLLEQVGLAALSTGARFYVSSVTGSSANSGTSQGQALATVNQALAKCTANKGDMIYIMPNHAETIADNDDLAISKAGVFIIGLGMGDDRPTFTFSATGSNIPISAANVTLHNLLFVAGIDSITNGITISAADCTIEGCEFRDTTDIEAIRWILTTAAADRLRLISNFHNGYTSGNAAVNFVRLIGTDGVVIAGNRFHSVYSTSVVEFHTTACLKVTLQGNIYHVAGTTNLSKNIIDTVTGSTWAATDEFDLGAGQAFAGGSGAAISGDDISAVASQVTALQTEVSGAAGIASFPAGAAAANAVSIAEVLRYLQENVIVGSGTALPSNSSLFGVLAGATGVATYPTAAAAANGVSIAEVLRYVSEFNTVQVVTRATAALPQSTDGALFTISGGMIQVLAIIGEVTTAIQNQANATKIKFNPTGAGSDVDLCGTLDIDNDAVGQIYSIVGVLATAMKSTTLWLVVPADNIPSPGLILGPGDIELDCAASNTGSVKWTLVYRKLESASAVVAA